MFKKMPYILVIALAIGGLFGAMHTSTPKPAEAAVDSWSGHTEIVVPFSQSITLNGAPAVLYTGVSTIRPNIRALTITDTASGTVELYDGAGGTGATVIAAFGVIANTPLVLTEDSIGVGIRATLGNGLYVSGATGTITITARVRKDPN